MAFNCYKCKGKHDTVRQARECSGIKPVQTITHTDGPEFFGKHPEEPATSAQIWKVGKCNGDQTHAAKLNQLECHNYINQLIKNQQVKPATEETEEEVVVDPESAKTKIPLLMLKSIPDGYYAVRPDSTVPFTYFRISRPIKGKFKGCLKVQTQHGDNLKLFLTLYPSDKVSVNRNDPGHKEIENMLLLAVIDPKQGKMNYSQSVNHCCQCGKTLTDSRSRWYGIGKECESKNQDIIGRIDELKGQYMPHRTDPGIG